MTCVRRRSFVVVNHKVSGSYISRTVCSRINIIYTDRLLSFTEYDVISYFRPDVIAKQLSRVEFLENGLAMITKFLHTFWATIGPTNLPIYDVTMCFRSAAKCK